MLEQAGGFFKPLPFEGYDGGTRGKRFILFTIVGAAG